MFLCPLFRRELSEATEGLPMQGTGARRWKNLDRIKSQQGVEGIRAQEERGMGVLWFHSTTRESGRPRV